MSSVIRDVLAGGPATMPGTPAAAIAGASTGANGVSSPAGASTSIARVQISIALGFVVAVGVLVLLNRAGFKFSVTVGG